MKIKSRTCWVRPPLTWGTRGPCSVGYRPQQLCRVGAVAPGPNPRHGTRCSLPSCVKPGGTETMWYLKNAAIPAPGLAFGRSDRSHKAVNELGPGSPSNGWSSCGESRGCSRRTCLESSRGHQSPREPRCRCAPRRMPRGLLCSQRSE